MKLTDLRERYGKPTPTSIGVVTSVSLQHGEKLHWLTGEGTTGCGISTPQGGVTARPSDITCWICLGALRGSGIWDWWQSEENPHREQMSEAEVAARLDRGSSRKAYKDAKRRGRA